MAGSVSAEKTIGNTSRRSGNDNAELHLKKQAETMTMLSIRDLAHSDDESGYDSDPDAIHNRSGTIEKQCLLFMGSTGGSAAAPFSSIKARSRTKGTVKCKSPGLEVLTRKGLVNDEEVVEAISPGGHVTKRRARSRPVSAELLESVHGTPVAPQDKVRCAFVRHGLSHFRRHPSATWILIAAGF